jgi:hypothetical protein
MDFDLTTTDGHKQALEIFDKYAWVYAPAPWLLKKTWDWVSSPDTIQEQRKTAIDLIKAGRENGVDEMKITLDQIAGIDIGADVEGIPIKAKVGKNGKMILEVKFRNA